jgi:hypothetical protein
MFFETEDGSNMFRRNVSKFLPKHIASHSFFIVAEVRTSALTYILFFKSRK